MMNGGATSIRRSNSGRDCSIINTNFNWHRPRMTLGNLPNARVPSPNVHCEDGRGTAGHNTRKLGQSLTSMPSRLASSVTSFFCAR